VREGSKRRWGEEDPRRADLIKREGQMKWANTGGIMNSHLSVWGEEQLLGKQS